MSVEVLIEKSCSSTGEGPHWDDPSQCLLYVDILAGDLHRWNSVTGKDEKVHFDKDVSFVVPCKKGGYILGLGRTLSHYDWDSGNLTVLKEVEENKNTRFNDGKCDPAGRIWAGTMGNEKNPTELELFQGSMYSLDTSGNLKIHRDLLCISNGFAWSEDNRTMYYIDSVARRVFAFDYDLTEGTISNGRVAVSFGGQDTIPNMGYPDGMTIDTDGKLWVACYGAGKVVRFDPGTGEEIQTIKFPAMRTTSCCFGGKNLDELYVTSGRFGMTDDEKEKTPLAGSVFRVTGLGVKGRPANVYLG